MSEYNFVEKPFLDQLAALGWTVIDQGTGVPTDPAVSLRAGFREVLLRGVFCEAMRSINVLPDGGLWLTDRQLDELHDQVALQPGHSLLEANEAVLKLLFKAQVDQNEVTGEEYPVVRLIDIENPECNRFHAINQFRIDTPGTDKACIIPDIVLFVNGLPLVVVECKDANAFTSNPMEEAFRQLMRYSDQRPETKAAGLREGEPRLFHTNQLLIRTNGDEADCGTITATDEEFFFPWKDIHPEKFRAYTPPLGKERAQEKLIQGMLPPETLLAIIHSCVLFMEVGKKRIKVVCRYQQFRAMVKIIERLRKGTTPSERSGVVWHTQGSGKSLTMVFVIRKIRRCDDLKDLKILLVNDRVDLEKQLGETAALTGEKVSFIRNSDALRLKLSGDASDLNMVMIHKFREAEDPGIPLYLRAVMEPEEPETARAAAVAREEVPRFVNFGIVNASERILLMIDEAHRTQSSSAEGSLSDNMFEAFPNATRLAFTGTPLIDVQVTRMTANRFGDYIDKYRLQDAVDDGATVQILYEGKTANTAIDDKVAFDDEIDATALEHAESQLRKAGNVATLKKDAAAESKLFDDLFKERTAAEAEALKKKWGTTGDILESEQRIRAIAEDLVNHYLEQIFPNGFKAQVVCSSKMAAIHYKTGIDAALAARLEAEDAKPDWGQSGAPPEDERGDYFDEALRGRLALLKSAVVVSSDGTNEPAVITAARKHSKNIDAVGNFKREFDFETPGKENTGIAFLIVCDMLLTGFDAPIEQVMYLDKKVRAHNLLQTIARVNRVAKGKNRGYIVDYVGLTNHLREALSIYAADDQADAGGSLTDISSEVPVLHDRYLRLLSLFNDRGVTRIQSFFEQTLATPMEDFDVLEAAIRLMKDIKSRASLEVCADKFAQSMDIILPHAAATPYKIPLKRLGYLMAKIRHRYRDETVNISSAGEKVRKIINDHLLSLGIDQKIPPVELLSPDFLTEIDKNNTAEAKASEMEHAIRKHCHVHFNTDPARFKKLSEKLERLIQEFANNWDKLCAELKKLRTEAEAMGTGGLPEGVSGEAGPFYRLLADKAFGDAGIPEEQKSLLVTLTATIFDEVRRQSGIVNFWNNAPAVSRLRGALSDHFVLCGIDEVADISESLITEVVDLAKHRHGDVHRNNTA